MSSLIFSSLGIKLGLLFPQLVLRKNGMQETGVKRPRVGELKLA